MLPIHPIRARRGLLAGLGLGTVLMVGGCGGTQTTGTQVQETAEMKAATEDMRSLYYNNPKETGNPAAAKKKTAAGKKK